MYAISPGSFSKVYKPMYGRDTRLWKTNSHCILQVVWWDHSTSTHQIHTW